VTTKDWKAVLGKFEIRGGNVSPLKPSKLNRYERTTGVKLPKSYRSYAQVFGPGYLTMPFYFCMCVPDAEAEEFDLEVLNENLKPLAERPDSPAIQFGCDMDQLKRAIFFATDIGTSRYFWDTRDTGKNADNEYGVYVIYRNYKIERLASTFWSFVNDVCIGSGVPGYDNTGGIDLVLTPGK